jgi:hypothetical protein
LLSLFCVITTRKTFHKHKRALFSTRQHTQSDGFSPAEQQTKERESYNITVLSSSEFHWHKTRLQMVQNSNAAIDKSGRAPAARLCEFNFWRNAPPVIYFRRRESEIARAQSVMKLTLWAWESAPVASRLHKKPALMLQKFCQPLQ